jgi:hypothetical protein
MLSLQVPRESANSHRCDAVVVGQQYLHDWFNPGLFSRACLGVFSAVALPVAE